MGGEGLAVYWEVYAFTVPQPDIVQNGAKCNNLRGKGRLRLQGFVKHCPPSGLHNPQCPFSYRSSFCMISVEPGHYQMSHLISKWCYQRYRPYRDNHRPLGCNNPQFSVKVTLSSCSRGLEPKLAPIFTATLAEAGDPARCWKPAEIFISLSSLENVIGHIFGASTLS